MIFMDARRGGQDGDAFCIAGHAFANQAIETELRRIIPSRRSAVISTAAACGRRTGARWGASRSGDEAAGHRRTSVAEQKKGGRRRVRSCRRQSLRAARLDARSAGHLGRCR